MIKKLLLKLLQSPQIKIVTVHSMNVRLEDWQANQQLVETAHKIQERAEFRAMVDVLKTEHPSNWALAIGTPLSDRAAMQSKIEGYNLCLNNLLAMAQPKSKVEPFVEATFAPAETDAVKV